jgi:hypothetical protein
MPAAAVYLLAGLVMTSVYVRLSATSGLNSDSADILLMGGDLLHGNLLLHGWFMSDVSFYPTELCSTPCSPGFSGCTRPPRTSRPG